MYTFFYYSDENDDEEELQKIELAQYQKEVDDYFRVEKRMRRQNSRGIYKTPHFYFE